MDQLYIIPKFLKFTDFEPYQFVRTYSTGYIIQQIASSVTIAYCTNAKSKSAILSHR